MAVIIIFFFVSGKFALFADVDGTSQYHNEEKDHCYRYS